MKSICSKEKERKSCFDVQATERQFRQHLSRTASLQQESRPPRSPEDGGETAVGMSTNREHSGRNTTEIYVHDDFCVVLWSTSWTQKRAVLPEETNLRGWVWQGVPMVATTSQATSSETISQTTINNSKENKHLLSRQCNKNAPK